MIAEFARCQLSNQQLDTHPGPVAAAEPLFILKALKKVYCSYCFHMYLKSPFPNPPTLPEANVHNIFFKRKEQVEWPDFIVHIDAETEEQVMYREFTTRIQDLATGLGAPIHQGGMGLRAESGEIIGILAENSSVRTTKMLFCYLALRS